MNDSGTIEIDGFRFNYRIEGTGPDTLVIGSSLYYTRSFSQELRHSLRLIFIDWRGFAESSPNNTSMPTFDVLLDDIEHIRHTLGLKKCIVIGHSSNGLLALEYAKKYPKHVSHVVMIGISPNLSPEHMAMAQLHWRECASPERKAALAERLRQFPDEELTKLPEAERFRKWNIRRVPLSWYDFHFDSAALWEKISPHIAILDFFYVEVLMKLDITKGLDALEIPVFLALGRHDFVVAPSKSWDPVRHKFKDLTVKMFERSAHSPQYEEPALFNVELLNWLKTKK